MVDKNGEEKTCKIASIRVINPYGIGAKEIRPNLSFIVDNYTVLCDNSKNLLKDKEFKSELELRERQYLLATINHNESEISYINNDGYVNAGLYNVTVISKESKNYKHSRRTFERNSKRK